VFAQNAKIKVIFYINITAKNVRKQFRIVKNAQVAQSVLNAKIFPIF